MTDFSAVTPSVRRRIKAYLAAETDYDPSTLRISSDNTMSAILDADRTYNAPETVRHLIGTVGQILSDMRR